jgi:hypothetical protein
MKKSLLGFCFITVFTLYANAQCANGRYFDKIFTQSATTVTYGNAMKFDSTYVDLKMDIYQPNGDNFAHRPLIVLAFPGSFTAGLRISPDIVTLCDNFSKRGYVCASIDYRLGFEDGSDCDTNQFKALMRGVQDMKAAVRYFYKDAQTTNSYRIDTSQIFIGGVSAGAFIGLNYAYGKEDTLSRIAPPWAVPALAALGGPEGNSGNPGYSTKVKGVIDLCGGIADTVWIMPNDPILVGVHGTADATVSCYFDSVYASTHPESLLFGGGDIKNRIENINLNNAFYLFQGADHVPFVLPNPFAAPATLYMDTTVRFVRDFLYANVICDSTTTGIKDETEGLSVVIYPNPSDDVVTIYSHYEQELTAEVFSFDGKLVDRKILPAHSSQTVSKHELNAGIYLIRISDSNNNARTQRIVFY